MIYVSPETAIKFILPMSNSLLGVIDGSNLAGFAHCVRAAHHHRSLIAHNLIPCVILFLFRLLH